MRLRNPAYVTKLNGKFVCKFPVVHPPFCRCERCAETRHPEDWSRAVTVRVFRRSPFPSDLVRSAMYSRQLKEQIEQDLQEAVRTAGFDGKATRGHVTFGEICAAYREHHRKHGKRLDKDEYVIQSAEDFFGAERDPEGITKDDYQKFCDALIKKGCAPATILRHTNTLIAILNSAVTDDLIERHQLSKIRRPWVRKKSKPVTFTRRQVEVLLGPAMDKYEEEQRSALESYAPWKQPAKPSLCPLRGLCLVAYYTLMRPANNFGLEWSQLTIAADGKSGSFRIDKHKNSSRGIEVEGAIHPELLSYLAKRKRSGVYVHPNPNTDGPYANIAQQWHALVAIANKILADEGVEIIEDRRAHFYTWRHTGASHLAEFSNPVMIGRMMGDTSLKTIMDHYFDSSMDHMTEMMQQWQRSPAAYPPKNRLGSLGVNRHGYVYFVASDSLVKIGWTNDVMQRFDALQSHSPVPLQLLGCIAGTMETEHALQAKFERWRKHGEWFELVPEVQTAIEALIATYL